MTPLSSTNSKFDHLYDLGPAKADGALRYERTHLTVDVDSNVYTGAPRLAHDEAWARTVERKSLKQNQLLSSPVLALDSTNSTSAMTIKISNEEMALLDDKHSMKFADGSGYIAEPTVYHELHCIVSICSVLYLYCGIVE